MWFVCVDVIKLFGISFVVLFLLYWFLVLKFVVFCIGILGGFNDFDILLILWLFDVFRLFGWEDLVCCNVEFKSFEYFLSFCRSLLIDLILFCMILLLEWFILLVRYWSCGWFNLILVIVLFLFLKLCVFLWVNVFVLFLKKGSFLFLGRGELLLRFKEWIFFLNVLFICV